MSIFTTLLTCKRGHQTMCHIVVSQTHLCCQSRNSRNSEDGTFRPSTKPQASDLSQKMLKPLIDFTNSSPVNLPPSFLCCLSSVHARIITKPPTLYSEAHMHTPQCSVFSRRNFLPLLLPFYIELTSKQNTYQTPYFPS